MLQENFKQVEENIRKACERAGRDPKEVTLIAVSKTKPVEMLREAYDFGTRVFGESLARTRCRRSWRNMTLSRKIYTGI